MQPRFPKPIPHHLLAKAEALGAAGAAWLREHDTSSALADFNAATKVVKSAHDLPLGEVFVLISIATAQFKGGLIVDGNATFHTAIVLAQDLPQRPKPQPGQPRQTGPGAHYKDEAFKQVSHGRDQPAGYPGRLAKSLGIWNKTGDDVDGAVVGAWLDADRPDEAIAAARKIENPQPRVQALLQVARTLLDRAGAPIF